MAEDEVLELLGKSTAYAEMKHLTMRLFSSGLARKTRAFSEDETKKVKRDKIESENQPELIRSLVCWKYAS
jgi:hypothetical protein